MDWITALNNIKQWLHTFVGDKCDKEVETIENKLEVLDVLKDNEVDIHAVSSMSKYDCDVDWLVKEYNSHHEHKLTSESWIAIVEWLKGE